jgi:hypothetical protein
LCPLVHNSHHSLLSDPIQNENLLLCFSASSPLPGSPNTDRLLTTNHSTYTRTFTFLGGALRLLLYLTSANVKFGVISTAF